MNQEPDDLESIQTALQDFLFQAPTPEDGLSVLIDNPQLLSDFVDSLFELLIADAREQENEELLQFFTGRHLLLQAVKDALSQKDIALLVAIRQLLLLKNGLATNTLEADEGKELLDFQDIMVKVLAWLKKPTIEMGISLLEQYPELLTDRPVRLFGWLIEEAGKHGDKVFVDIIKTLREFLQTLRIALIDKNRTSVSKNDLSQAIKEALEYTDFSAFSIQPEPAIFLA
ncbi:MAG: hypothetical protein DRR16_24855 [Candidatus Parabeggiatoa sp. nov. 3]|nr:MAG: hypothetical protein DRR00_24280 [Gammaproteobacteria bacterium]RKZ58509.1 MAG: hypothetical protein DRQ99_25315 [Gammaproteobacteria bacterium]RKZ79906.1 MAG: hypothetical protein DRR16_24855 [Gammaproteobacteria bacterium]